MLAQLLSFKAGTELYIRSSRSFNVHHHLYLQLYKPSTRRKSEDSHNHSRAETSLRNETTRLMKRSEETLVRNRLRLSWLSTQCLQIRVSSKAGLPEGHCQQKRDETQLSSTTFLSCGCVELHPYFWTRSWRILLPKRETFVTLNDSRKILLDFAFTNELLFSALFVVFSLHRSSWRGLNTPH